MFSDDIVEAGVQADHPFDYLDQVDSKQSCIFTSSIVKVRVGASARVFSVHKDVIVKAGGSLGESTRLVDVEPSVFELVLCYLYGGRYKTYESTSHPKPSTSDREVTCLFRACQLYCFADKYGIDQLQQKTRRDIEASKVMDYEAIVKAAKLIYSSSPVAVAPWFATYLAQHTRRAMTDKKVAFQQWFLDIFREPCGDMATVIFELFRDMHMNPQRSLTPVSAETGDCSLAQSNACLQADDTNPVSETSPGEIPVSEEASFPEVPTCVPDAIESTIRYEEEQNDPRYVEPGRSKTKQKKKKRKRKPEDVVFDEFDQPIYPNSEPVLQPSLVHDETDPKKAPKHQVPSTLQWEESDPTVEEEVKELPELESEEFVVDGWGSCLESEKVEVPPAADCENGPAIECGDLAPLPGAELVPPSIDDVDSPVPSKKKKKKGKKEKKTKRLMDRSLTDIMPSGEGDQIAHSTIEPWPEPEPQPEPETEFELGQIDPEEHEDFTVTIGLEIFWLGQPYRYIRREKIKGWTSFIESVLTSMPHCLTGLGPGERLWLTDIRVLSQNEWYSVTNDIEATTLRILKEGTKQLGIVNFSMVLHSATDNLDDSAILVGECS